MEHSYSIRKLEPDDSVSCFKSGDAIFTPLKTFLQKHAQDFQAAHVAQTYVAVDDSKVVIGFVTLTCSEIDLRNGYELIDCQHANRYDTLPAIKIVRLAVDSRYRYKRIGENLFSHTLGVIITQISPFVGCRFIITDAKNNAVSFYTKQGFILLDTEENKQRESPVMFFDLLPYLE
jgi:GNAT superfamily N-acetyltransferase